MYRLGGTDILHNMLSQEIRKSKEYSDYMNDEISYEQWKYEQKHLTEDLITWSWTHAIVKDLDEHIIGELNKAMKVAHVDTLSDKEKNEWRRKYENDKKAYQQMLMFEDN